MSFPLRLLNCRRQLEGISKWIYTTQRHRSGGHKHSVKPLKPHPPYRHKELVHHPSRKIYPKSRLSNAKPPAPIIAEADVTSYFQSHVAEWATNSEILDRLISFGLPEDDARKLLAHFSNTVVSGALSDAANFDFYQLSRFSMPQDQPSTIDTIYTTIFFWWAARRDHRDLLLKDAAVDAKILDSIQNLVQLTDRAFPADEFPLARRTRRKIIMHVGPTNSGKTHYALRALAAAYTGVYAGPLRLLAHEIWERLNTGQIVPLGVEQASKPSTSSPHAINPAYVRPCNMLTGEEQKLMGEDVPLLSCTIEMLQLGKHWDVVVIDEIQMLGDVDRGFAWVNAVLGVNATEIHLCGEETAVPIVRELLNHTGDEIVVKRYERLSPLVVEDQSLDGDLTNVQKGDCIVAFSRTAIFGLKDEVEKKTGMRCAVVYGRLPPEVRSEQAALFNDPNSGYDVLIGSDAIGMGLNLKIKRIIFHASSKWDGREDLPIPVSSVKQIAGRAGRFGLHDSNLGGRVTTLHAEGLPYIKKCLAESYKPLSFAYINQPTSLFMAVCQVLPDGASMKTVLEASTYAGRLPPVVRYKHEKTGDVCHFIDMFWNDMSTGDRLALLNAPIPWKDAEACAVIKEMLLMHEDRMSASLRGAIGRTPYMKTMESEERTMLKGKTSSKAWLSLIHLEILHKVVVFYMWMSFRYPVIYADYADAMQLKGRVEMVLNWCLDKLSRRSVQRTSTKSRPTTTQPELVYFTKADLMTKPISRPSEQARAAALNCSA